MNRCKLLLTLIVLTVQGLCAQNTVRLELGHVTIQAGDSAFVPVRVIVPRQMTIPPSFLLIDYTSDKFSFHGLSTEQPDGGALLTALLPDRKGVAIGSFPATDTAYLGVLRFNTWDYRCNVTIPIRVVDWMVKDWSGQLEVQDGTITIGKCEVTFSRMQGRHSWYNELNPSFSVNRQPRIRLTRKDIRIIENGREIKNYFLQDEHEDASLRPLSLTMVIDASLDASGKREAFALLDHFQSYLTAGKDRLSLAVIDSVTHIANDGDEPEKWFEVMNRIHSSIPSGAGRFFDGLDEMYNNHFERLYLIFTNGRDTSSTQKPSGLAWNYSIVCGVGEEIDSTALASIPKWSRYSELYIHPTRENMRRIYYDLAYQIICLFPPRISFYPYSCPDGTAKTVEWSVTVCDTLYSHAFSYVDARDTTRYTSMTFSLRDHIDSTGQEFRLPFRTNPYESDTMGVFQFDLEYDPLMLRFLGVETMSTLLEGIPVLTDSIGPGLVRIRTLEPFKLERSQVLMDFLFQPTKYAMSGVTTIRVSDWIPDAGCYKVHPTTASVRFHRVINDAERIPRPENLNASALFPHPLSLAQPVSIEIDSDRPSQISILFYDVLGRPIPVVRDVLSDGKRVLHFQLPQGLLPGVYAYRVYSSHSVITSGTVLVSH